MTVMYGIFSNKAIMVPVFAWFVAQLIKVITVIIRDRKVDFTRIFGAGGMPSSHSSFIVSLATVVGLQQGFQSTQFAITFAIALIVMYDAAGVRRAAGKHAEAINKIIFSQNYDDILDIDKLKELIGHSPLEVTMGAILGITMGLLFGM